MKNVKFVILTLVAVFLSVTHLYAFHSPNAIDNKLYTKDTLVLEPLASDNAYQEAKLWFLPDYQESISSDKRINEDKDKKPNTPNNCNTFNNDGSGRTYIESPDFNRYQCSGPQSMANKVKCYYGCVCKPAVRFDSVSETCAYFCNGTCVGGVSCKPAVYPGTGEHCTLSCAGNSGICIIKACNTQVYPGVGEQCNQYCASNGSICTSKGCKAAVSVGTGESCTQRCASNSNVCTAKACNSAVSVGTGESCTQRCASNSNICTGKACNAAVSVGTGESCTQRCASNSNVCTAKACNSAVSVGTGESCSQRCASNSNVCTAKACNAAVSVGTGESCTQRCASNSNVCTAKACNSAVSVGTGESCTQKCASNSNVCTAKACNSAVSVGTGESCTQKCASNSNVCTAKACNTAVSVGSGETCTQRCASNNAVCTAKGCASGYTSSGGACVCATSCSHKVTSKPENSYYTTTSCSACGVTSSIQTGWECNSGYNKSGNSCVAACTLPTCTDSVTSKPANSYYTTASCTDCSGTKNVNTGWECYSGYDKSGDSCVKGEMTIELCVDIRDKNTNKTIEPFCGFQHLMLAANGTYHGHNYGPVWTGPNSGPVMNCTTTTISIPDGKLNFEYLPLQSTWSCGYYTTMCDTQDSRFTYEGDLRYEREYDRGAYKGYDFNIYGDAKLTVIYNCTVSSQ